MYATITDTKHDVNEHPCFSVGGNLLRLEKDFSRDFPISILRGMETLATQITRVALVAAVRNFILSLWLWSVLFPLILTGWLSF